MTTSFAPLTVAIGDLVPHPANVRSNSPETYDPENIAHLKASIAVLGLLQPLLVQKLDGKYAVLAGGRRHAALMELTAALGTTAPVDLGRGMTLTRRRVAGEMRLELSGADRGMIDGLKALGCFTEIIAFQLRVFLPHGEGIDTGRILARIVGQRAAVTAEQAA